MSAIIHVSTFMLKYSLRSSSFIVYFSNKPLIIAHYVKRLVKALGNRTILRESFKNAPTCGKNYKLISILLTFDIGFQHISICVLPCQIFADFYSADAQVSVKKLCGEVEMDRLFYQRPIKQLATKTSFGHNFSTRLRLKNFPNFYFIIIGDGPRGPEFGLTSGNTHT